MTKVHKGSKTYMLRNNNIVLVTRKWEKVRTGNIDKNTGKNH